MIRKTSSSSSLKLELSLASLMFFGPFIKHMIREDGNFDLSEEEKKFIKGYMLLGSINLALGLLTATLWTLSTFFPYQRISILFITFSVVLLFLLVGGSILAFTNIPITTSKNTDLAENISKELEGSNDILLHYLPIINFYTWYTLHDFDGNQTILKESMIVWTVFAIISFFGNSWIISIFLIVIIMRIILLIIFGNTAPKRWVNMIDMLFYKNIEECWGGFIGLLVRSLGKVFGRTTTLSTEQNRYKLPYSCLYDIRKYSNIQWQYFLLLMGSGYLFTTFRNSDIFGFIILGTCLFLGRYMMMAIIWKRLPPIPIVDDIFRTVWSLFNYKT